MSDKETVIDLLKRLPDTVNLKDIAREIDLLAGIRDAEAQADRGEVVPHEQIKREFNSWISK